MTEIVSLNNKERWDEIIFSMKNYDFYHWASYHQLDTSGTPLLFYHQVHGVAFAFPLIFREIESEEYMGYRDVTSVYGYAGPLCSEISPSREAVLSFQNQLLAYFTEEKVVSAFSRFHPLIDNQSECLKGVGVVENTNQTVGIDLVISEKEQKKQYSSTLKNNINKLIREGVVVKRAETQDEILSFVKIYHENMQRVNASPYYYFSLEYFQNFLTNIPAEILLAYYKGQIVSGVLFTQCNGVMQTHLSATKTDFLHLSPLKYLWDQVRKIGKEREMSTLHLGGGYGGQEDSLFAFKSQFSKLRFTFKTWRYIHNQEVYDSLVESRFQENIPESLFFPLYRA